MKITAAGLRDWKNRNVAEFFTNCKNFEYPAQSATLTGPACFCLAAKVQACTSASYQWICGICCAQPQAISTFEPLKKLSDPLYICFLFLQFCDYGI